MRSALDSTGKLALAHGTHPRREPKVSMKRIGYIGLGIMGRPMAENLIDAGFELTVWNRTRSKADPLLERGASWADGPAALAAQVEALCINVTDTPDVEDVLFGEGGVIEADAADTDGLFIIDHSTISPAATRGFAERLAERNITLLDAPVSGGDKGAKAGTLSVMIGGPEEAFERCRPIFDAVGGNGEGAITHVGPAGDGQACKACNQVLCAVNLVAVCEAMGLAAAEGLDLGKMLNVTTAGAGGSWALENLGPQIAAGDMSPGFMIDLINKDLGIVHDEAANQQLPMPGTHLAAELLRSAAAHGHGRDGTQALSRVFEMLGRLNYHK